jgi:hypothetical protein
MFQQHDSIMLVIKLKRSQTLSAMYLKTIEIIKINVLEILHFNESIRSDKTL